MYNVLLYSYNDKESRVLPFSASSLNQCSSPIVLIAKLQIFGCPLIIVEENDHSTW